jgi:hypothetical protein
MKAYFAQNQFCMVGKAWEVRYSLRKMLANQSKAHQPLIDVLKKQFVPHAGSTKRSLTLACDNSIGAYSPQ